MARKVLKGQASSVAHLVTQMYNGQQVNHNRVLSPTEGYYNYMNIPPYRRYEIHQQQLAQIEELQSKVDQQTQPQDPQPTPVDPPATDLN